MCGKYENISYMIVTQDLVVYNSILSLLGSEMVSLVRMVSLDRNGKVYLGLNVSSSTYNCG